MTRTTALRIALLCAGGIGTVPSCASKSGTDSSTHWLDECKTDADCDGLSCKCGACTKGCSTPSDCSRLSPLAACAAVDGCNSAATVCQRATPVDLCPAGVNQGELCDGTIARCTAPCSQGGSNHLRCIDKEWVNELDYFSCNGGECPTGAEGGAPCDGAVQQCWLACNQGFRGQLACSGGIWQAGHGLFPCGATVDGGAAHTVTPVDAGVDGAPAKDGNMLFHGVSTVCRSNADCYAANDTCCGTCGDPKISDEFGIALASSGAYNDALCTGAAACACVPPSGTLEAFCNLVGSPGADPIGHCYVEDFRDRKACKKNEDCWLTTKDCCQCGTLDRTAFMAVSRNVRLCAGVACREPCVGNSLPSDGSKATCNVARGYCELTPPQ